MNLTLEVSFFSFVCEKRASCLFTCFPTQSLRHLSNTNSERRVSPSTSLPHPSAPTVALLPAPLFSCEDSLATRGRTTWFTYYLEPQMHRERTQKSSIYGPKFVPLYIQNSKMLYSKLNHFVPKSSLRLPSCTTLW